MARNCVMTPRVRSPDQHLSTSFTLLPCDHVTNLLVSRCLTRSASRATLSCDHSNRGATIGASDRATFMASRYTTKNGRTSKRGLFSSGVWHCDCENRMPADKFQTKKAGKNHGRWFYTCQKSQTNRCGFFLWEDEAKVREEGAVLSNSRSEPTSPQTPRRTAPPTRQAKLGGAAQIVTPVSPTKNKQSLQLEAFPPASNNGGHDDGEWGSDTVDDDALVNALDEFETPRKAARTETITSPSKREASNRSDASSVTLPLHDTADDDVFTTPSTTKRPYLETQKSGLPSPLITPCQPPHAHPPFTPDTSSLTSSALHILAPISLPPTIQDQLVELLNRHELRTTGIAKGRDITRLAVQAKERRIADLEARIKGLEQEKETMRSVVQHLKSDIMVSPKKPRRPKEASDADAAKEGKGRGAGWRTSVV